MADSKVSELTAATSVAATDKLYLVAGSDSKNITIANVFATVPTPASFAGKFSIAGTPDTITAPGVISVATNTTLITNPSGNGNCTIGAGVAGQIKNIIMTSNTGSNTVTLQDSQLGHSSIAFVNAGDTAQIIYLNDKWYRIGGTATVS